MRSTIVVDLGFGDAGKGATVDYLARIAGRRVLVVRFNGGGQAAHNVVAPDGKHHTFSMFGSGTLAGAATYLSRFVLVDPIVIRNEARALHDLLGHDPLCDLFVDIDAPVVTRFHKVANRLREMLRGEDRHGSCGMGIGEAMADSLNGGPVIRVATLRDRVKLRTQLREIQEAKYEEFRHAEFRFDVQRLATQLRAELEDGWSVERHAAQMRATAHRFTSVSGRFLRILDQRMVRGPELIFEGAQGVLLDQDVGFHPYTTWSKTTFDNAGAVLKENGLPEGRRLGVLRAYHTRHGAGPFPTEDDMLATQLPDPHNGTGLWQGQFRVGWFDLVLARYAIAACSGIDALVLTHLDRIESVQGLKIGHSYLLNPRSHVVHLTPRSTLEDQEREVTNFLKTAAPHYVSIKHKEYVPLLSRFLAVPITLTAYGPTAADRVPMLSPSGV